MMLLISTESIIQFTIPIVFETGAYVIFIIMFFFKLFSKRVFSIVSMLDNFVTFHCAYFLKNIFIGGRAVSAYIDTCRMQKHLCNVLHITLTVNQCIVTAYYKCA